MNKKLISMALLVCSIPVAANASWTFNTWAKSAGGTIASRNNAAQTSVNGSVFGSYTTHATLAPATVTAAAGYDISNVTLNGVSLGAQASPYTAALISGGALAKTSQSLYATFRAKLLPLTASTDVNGSVSPASIAGIYAGKTISPLSFTFQPKAGYKVAAIAGVDPAYTVAPSIAAALVNQAVKVTIPTGTTLSAAVALSGSFSSTLVTANAGTPKVSLPAASVILTGTAVNADASTGTWTQTSGASVGTLTGNPVTFTTPATVGSLGFKFTVGTASAVTTVNVSSDLKAVAQAQCINCHNENNVGGVGMPTIVLNNWAASPTNYNPGMCSQCHIGADTGSHSGVIGGKVVASHDDKGLICSTCHTNSTNGDAHAIDTSAPPLGCIDCHSTGQNSGAGFVQDNNGVRSITQEFTKWSHHVTGVTLQDAHCAACHLEGKAVNGKIVTDSTKHVADAKIHLRNATTDADMQWDPAAPNHTTMDNFCMTCHSATGYSAPSAAAIQAIMVPAAGKTASASNPFGDTISNRYDKMQRPAVVDVDGQFDTTNNSHHAVKGARYTGKTSTVGDPRVIASPATLGANTTAGLFGTRSTIYDSVNATSGASEKAVNPAFNALYAPLGTVVPPTAATELGDDSRLHCGDCHTVGQYKAGVATNAAGVLNTAVIGAHGSNNEYLLRNDKGTDERHAQDAYTTVAGVVVANNPNAANLVCFNCHAYKRYGSVYAATGTAGPHAGEYDASGRCNSQANTIPFNGYTTGTATDGTQFQSRFMGPVSKYAGTAAFAPGFPLNAANKPTVAEINPDFGNTLGIQCANCHNSGAGNAYGGIHGSKNNQELAGYTNDPSVTGGSYIDGMGNTTKIMRFLPGLGDAMHVPGTLGGMVAGKEGTTTKFKNYSSDRKTPAMYTELPVRDNRTAVNAKAGSYNFQSGGVSSDTNWEQIGWKQTTVGSNTNTAQQMAQGAGCYTLADPGHATSTRTYTAGSKDNNGNNMPAYDTNGAEGLEGPSQSGNATPVELVDNWGGCDDHGAPIGGGNHGFIKRIVRPVTY